MTDRPIDERTFTDQEVREILKRAVAQTPSSSLVKAEGTTLAEIQAIGDEVGIDPNRLEEAARAIVARKGRGRGGLFGGPLHIEVERRVTGELEPDDWSDVVSRIRSGMGQQGEVTEYGGSLEWSFSGESGTRYVMVSSKSGSTTVRGAANLNTAALAMYLPTGILGTVATAIGLTQAAEAGSLLGLGLCLSILPVLYTVLRIIMGNISSSTSKRLQRVVDEISQLPAPVADSDDPDA